MPQVQLKSIFEQSLRLGIKDQINQKGLGGSLLDYSEPTKALRILNNQKMKYEKVNFVNQRELEKNQSNAINLKDKDKAMKSKIEQKIIRKQQERIHFLIIIFEESSTELWNSSYSFFYNYSDLFQLNLKKAGERIKERGYYSGTLKSIFLEDRTNLERVNHEGQDKLAKSAVKPCLGYADLNIENQVKVVGSVSVRFIQPKPYGPKLQEILI
ncbi:unnamed protein product [Paramecium pentaurelia]|uniref:Uncharacterized protein n=1 Tax=Paramecium pentaurelia TaxID=43138 RepID=A0A8S1VF01_9CILI|nr:unnamed protein product [Paramecium pentaurelia]